jgi:hypothetical protein
MKTMAVVRYKIRMEPFAADIINRISNSMNFADFVIDDMTLPSYRIPQFNRQAIKILYKMTS